MKGLSHPKRIFRTTLDKMEGAPLVGVYVLAYMGRIVYVGKASSSVSQRLESHMNNLDPLGVWMLKNGDWENVRVDVLEIPDSFPVLWLEITENLLIKKFKPLFNEKLQEDGPAYVNPFGARISFMQAQGVE